MCAAIVKRLITTAVYRPNVGARRLPCSDTWAIWEKFLIKPNSGTKATKCTRSSPNRTGFCVFSSQAKKIIITNAFEKKTDNLPKREKEKALVCRANYEQRVSENTYYENL
jgi:hypothetical protein